MVGISGGVATQDARAITQTAMPALIFSTITSASLREWITLERRAVTVESTGPLLTVNGAARTTSVSI